MCPVSSLAHDRLTLPTRARKTYWGDLPGQIDILCQLHLALLERTLEISLADRFAAIRLLVDERNEAVFNLKVHLETLADFLLEVAGGGNREFLASMVIVLAGTRSRIKRRIA